jgi:septal ring factor EnvC (AmiA/AmiB activator)
MGGTASKANKITPLSAEDNSKLLQQQISQLQQHLESSKQQNAQLQQQLESGKQQIAQLQQQLESGKQQIAQLQQQLESGKQQTGQLQQQVENDQPSTAQFVRDLSYAAQRKDEVFMLKIFNRHATKEQLSASALIAALKDVAAPVLVTASSEGSLNTADFVFRRADANLSGDVDFSE